MIRILVRKILLNLHIYLSHNKRILGLYRGFSIPSYSLYEEKIKPKLSQIIDYLYLFFKLMTLPSNYHILLFDSKKRKEFKRFVGCSLTDPYTSNKLNVLWGKNTILVHDKLIFKVICEHFSLPVPLHYGILHGGLINGQPVDFQRWMEKNSLDSVVLKPRLGAFGVGIKLILRDEIRNFESMAKLNQQEYIVEEHIRQDSILNKINPHSVNSVRVITFLCSDGKVEILGAMLRTSPNKTFVDNFTLGGIAVGIDITSGKLKNQGFVKFLFRHASQELEIASGITSINRTIAAMLKQGLLSPGKIFLRHPITDTEFKNFQIPYWDELKEIAVKAQRVFYHIKSIGWDFAITPKGPVIIEGNQSWGTIGLQATNGGLLTPKNKKLFAQYGISFY